MSRLAENFIRLSLKRNDFSKRRNSFLEFLHRRERGTISGRRETTVFGGASTERNTGKDKVGLVNAGIVRRGIKRVFLPRRLSSVVFLATGVSPVYGRNKREKYYRPFVSS